MNSEPRQPFETSASSEEPANSGEAASARPTFGNPPRPVRDPPGWPIYFAAFVVTGLWAGAIIAYAVGYQRGISPLDYQPFALGVLAALVVGPTALVWIAAYALRQGMRLSAEVRRARETAARMLAPAGLAAAEAGTVVEAVRARIDDAAAATREASEIMGQVREGLERETERLNEAAATSGRAANEAAGVLGEERGRLSDLSETLGAQAGAIRQAADHAAEVTTAAGQAGEAARTAGEDLARHVERLESAGTGVGEQLRATEQGLSTQNAALSELAQRLKSEQETLAAEADQRIARLNDLVVQSRAAAAEVSETGQQGSEAIQHLTAAAAEHFTELKAAADREREALTEALQASIQHITATAEEARRAAESYAEAARSRVDQLNEAAFEAGRKADAAFETRLNEAKGLIDQAAEMIDTAGGKATERLGEWTVSAKATLGDLEKLMGEIAERAEALPAEAERRAEAVRASMEQNLGNLVASAKHASDETQALDEAFQNRVRANYQTLSEAVRLMGVVAGEPGAAPADGEGQPSNLRGRLRLTPAEAEAEPEPEPEPEEEGLGWKGLLESLDRDGADPEQLSERMVAEVKGMGVDPGSILPPAKVDEIAAAVQTGDAEGARQVVRNIAGSATDKLSKRLFADAALRGQADRYRRRFSGMLKDAAKRDQQGFMVGSLLASDEGRTYLLLEAAAPDKG